MPTATPRDFYEVLGVDRNATDDQIKRAYRALARKYHPDANQNDASSAEHFKEVSVAYEALSDPEKRRRYDMFGPDNSGGGGGPADGFGLNDLFGAFFGGSGFGGGGGGPRRGPDAEYVLDLTLEQAAAGATHELDLNLQVACEDCGGNGCQQGTFPQRCSACSGSGEVRMMRRSILGQIVTAGPCETCAGTGQTIPAPCATCRGEGRVRDTVHLPVDVPAGIDNGQRLRLSGRGPAAQRGGASGDLYVTIRVRPHDRFERDGDDLHMAQRIAMTQAALGITLNISTIDGNEEVIVAPGTQGGHIIKIKGRGVPSLRTGRRGDLHVHLDVEVPTRLNAEQADLLAQFAELRGELVDEPREGIFSRLRSAFGDR